MSKLSFMMAICLLLAMFVAIYAMMGYALDRGRPETLDPLAGTFASELQPTATRTQSTATARIPTSTATARGPAPSATSITSGSLAQSSRVTPPASPTPSPTATIAEPTVTPTIQTTTPPPPTPTEARLAPTPRPMNIATPTVVSATPTASATESPDAELVLLVRRAEGDLRTGHIEATIENGDRINSSSSMSFDFGDATQPPRLHFMSSYLSAEAHRTTELIIVDGRFWERIDGIAWAEVDAREGVQGQVQGYLPGVAALSDTVQIEVDGALLRWFDPLRDADVTLQVDPASGVPRELRRVSRSNDTVVVVRYSGWNDPVDIQPPTVS